jgi:hypothetical protein
MRAARRRMWRAAAWVAAAQGQRGCMAACAQRAPRLCVRDAMCCAASRSLHADASRARMRVRQLRRSSSAAAHASRAQVSGHAQW